MVESTARPLGIAVLLVVTSCSATEKHTGTPPSASAIVEPAVGAVLSLQGVRLTIPPGSLNEPATIGITEVPAVPTGESDGFLPAGPAYRFSPPGTTFSLAVPAQLRMNIDEGKIVSEGLDTRTVTLFYFDDKFGRFLAVAGNHDPAQSVVTGAVEHFTVAALELFGFEPFGHRCFQFGVAGPNVLEKDGCAVGVGP